MKQCQSCGMPLSKDSGGGGTERDGRKSETYCSLCYRDGEFIGKDCSVAQMQDIVEQALKKQGHSLNASIPVARFLRRRLDLAYRES